MPRPIGGARTDGALGGESASSASGRAAARSGTDEAVLIVAPLPEELRPLLRRLGGRRVASLPGGAVYSARWREREVLAALVGDGARLAGRSLERLGVWLGESRPAGPKVARTLLVGVAGGLSPDLETGALVRAAQVVAPQEIGEPRCWRSPDGGDGTVVVTERIVGSAGRKRALWNRLGRPERAVVDLESAVFVLWAGRAGLGWTVLRTVSDRHDESLPLDLAAASDEGGHVRRSRVLAQLARRPAALGAVLGLRRRMASCAERLGDAAREWIATGGACV